MNDTVVVPSPTEKKVKDIVSLPKHVKIVGRMAHGNGATRKGYTRAMADAMVDYNAFKKANYRGAWWLRYFKGQQEE